MNPITGDVTVEINGKGYTLRFDWSCLAEIEMAHGDSPNLFNPDVVASVAAIGFKRNHPEMTADVIKEISPPLLPFARTVQTAMQYAYFGMEGVPSDVGEKKSPPKDGWSMRIKRLFGKG